MQTLLSSGGRANVVAAVSQRLQSCLVPLTPSSLRVAIAAADALASLVEGPVAEAVKAATSHGDLLASTAVVLSLTPEDWQVGATPVQCLLGPLPSNSLDETPCCVHPICPPGSMPSVARLRCCGCACGVHRPTNLPGPAVHTAPTRVRSWCAWGPIKRIVVEGEAVSTLLVIMFMVMLSLVM